MTVDVRTFHISFAALMRIRRFLSMHHRNIVEALFKRYRSTVDGITRESTLFRHIDGLLKHCRRIVQALPMDHV